MTVFAEGCVRTKDRRHTPWAVLISIKEKVSISVYRYFCSGSIIGEKFVLTAAHCVCSGNITRIRVGNMHNLKMYYVEKSHIHPSFQKKMCGKRNQNAKHDIAVLKTTRSILYSKFIKPIAIDYHKIPNDLPAIKIGYGSDRTLRYGNTRAKTCRREFICAPRDRNRGVGGDSGGPLVSCRDGFKGADRLE